MESFRQEMDDDFNTPRALALIFDEVRALNRLLDEKKTQGLEKRGARFGRCVIPLAFFAWLFRAQKGAMAEEGNLTAAEIDELIGRRDRARAKELAGGRSHARRIAEKGSSSKTRRGDPMEGQVRAETLVRRLLISPLASALGSLLALATRKKICRARTRGQAEISLRKSVNTRKFQGQHVEGEERLIGNGDSFGAFWSKKKDCPGKNFTVTSW